ncbi:MAG: phage baseplate assembly protein V [Desulfobacteraceae bacterium]|nr:phage baseplate assembly protein V [Desulfobacteraceae bacterium]
MLDQVLEKIAALEAKLNQIIRVGKVAAYYPKKGAVRVELGDADGLVSYTLPVLYPKTSHDKFYWMPDIDEQVLCVFLPFGLEQGFVVGSLYSKVDTTPVQSKDKALIRFKDNAVFEYDRAGHCLTINVPGNAKINFDGGAEINFTDPVNITTPVMNLNGNLVVKGSISATKAVTGKGGCSFSGGGDIAAGITGNVEVKGNISSTGTISGNSNP